MPVSVEDWLITLARLAAVIGMGYGAYLGLRRWRAERNQPTPEAAEPPATQEKTSES